MPVSGRRVQWLAAAAAAAASSVMMIYWRNLKGGATAGVAFTVTESRSP
jgi:ethanolamine utilization microcompartment shell protein EutL